MPKGKPQARILRPLVLSLHAQGMIPKKIAAYINSNLEKYGLKYPVTRAGCYEHIYSDPTYQQNTLKKAGQGACRHCYHHCP